MCGRHNAEPRTTQRPTRRAVASVKPPPPPPPSPIPSADAIDDECRACLAALGVLPLMLVDMERILQRRASLAEAPTPEHLRIPFERGLWNHLRTVRRSLSIILNGVGDSLNAIDGCHDDNIAISKPVYDLMHKLAERDQQEHQA